MKQPVMEREQVVQSLVKQEINRHTAAQLLGCTTRTIDTYVKNYQQFKLSGLIDHRHSNYCKLTSDQISRIVALKSKQLWRSARNVRDYYNLPVHQRTIWRIFQKSGLAKPNLKRIKPIKRFEAANPNDLWQTDIMGKINFPSIGDLYLIATLDDYSRFVPEGRWFRNQGKMNVFNVWYESLSKCGAPVAMLQDEGSQYKAKLRLGQADYEWYAKRIGVKLIWAHKACTKGKIERFWKFVQKDFAPGVLKAKTLEEVNGNFRSWLAFYNYKFRSDYFDQQTHAARYHKSERRLSRVELETLLCIEERRKVTRESTISLYGKHYYIPPGYIGCHIWVKIKGGRLYFEANNRVFSTTRLRF